MEKLLKENYDLSSYVVRGLETYNFRPNPGENYSQKEFKVFKIEDELSEEEKLKIIDNRTDGAGSYMLEVFKQYQEDKENGIIKRTSGGGLHRSSLVKWIDNHNEKKVIWVSYVHSYPLYRLFRDSYRFNELTPSTEYGYKYLYTDKSIIHQWFHDMLLTILDEENKYFKENDPYQIKYKKLKDMAYKLQYFIELLNDEKLFNIANGGSENLINEEIEHYYNKLSKITTKIEDMFMEEGEDQ